jgi:hypothetical protein
MGWNDHLLDNPYVPYENPRDREDYENWQMYLEECQRLGLTSQNIDPAAQPAQPPATEKSGIAGRRCIEFFNEVLGIVEDGNAKEE